MTNTRLIPCRFCGETLRMGVYPAGDLDSGSAVFCNECDCRGPVADQPVGSGDAERLWNQNCADASASEWLSPPLEK